MKVIVKARHMKLTESLKSYAEEKLITALSRIWDREAARIEIELCDIAHSQNQQNKECHVTVYMPGGKTIVITEIDDDMYKAIDFAHDRLLQNVKRNHDKMHHITQQRKYAVRSRHDTVRRNFTLEPEKWELELREYERSMAS